ncbi:uncharacterized protein LOC18430816 isoform X1 [Amborella trichopoda]|uniref:INO80 complex subunit B-like conserved region domain-containing protein n=1 Tax=Amborella trichopoda TaxID=13333 RepID=W1P6V3_AMBTC|nr:uncharacterized protein LOC18430816 isoform X1 [Amborella trichopoda]XP_011622084.1 uncharacterized protein LOC18430816 isoform X1 [Amborella trichopoda]ERN02695.1 hypothetical protein AMTR_s00085p00107610 [Amborella trichopoda]|eukprot:XP_006841020.1 uncharacterized protein LOC18430816 isoform X1 [Amborella trichopoda]
MEHTEGLDFNTVKGVRKPRTFSSRKPRIGSHSFRTEYDCDRTSPSDSPPDTGATHIGSSSENLGKHLSDDDGYDNNGYEVQGKSNLHDGSLQYEASNEYAPADYAKREKGRFSQKTNFDDIENHIRMQYEREHNEGYGGYEKTVHDCTGDGGLNHRMSISRGSNSNGQGKFGSTTRCSEGVLAPAKRNRPNWRDVKLQPLDAVGPEPFKGGLDKQGSFSEAGARQVLPQEDPSPQGNRPTKVKLKVGGITHTIHANQTGNDGSTRPRYSDGSSSVKPPSHSSDIRRRKKLIIQDNSEDEYDYPPRLGKEKNLSEVSRMDATTSSSTHSRSKIESHSIRDTTKTSEESNSVMQTQKPAEVLSSQTVRKSARVPKRRVLDGDYVEDNNETDAFYRKNRVSTKRVVDCAFGDDYEEATPQRRSSRAPKGRRVEEGHEEDEVYYVTHHSKQRKRNKLVGKVGEVIYQEDDEEATSANDFDGNSGSKKRNKKQEFVDYLDDDKKELPLTARQRALQSSKVANPEATTNLMAFPDGLPMTGRRRQKEKLSEVEQQLKKAEAAQRRRMQVEKAAKEIQAEAIRKILGNDPSREKRRDKLRKKQDGKAREKATASRDLESNSVRWVTGPCGTIVSFSEDAGLPSIFKSTKCSYPPPREKCAVPSCTNDYKYRDSKSNLPLCSLQCYRAVHNEMLPVTSC